MRAANQRWQGQLHRLHWQAGHLSLRHAHWLLFGKRHDRWRDVHSTALNQHQQHDYYNIWCSDFRSHDHADAGIDGNNKNNAAFAIDGTSASQRHFVEVNFQLYDGEF